MKLKRFNEELNDIDPFEEEEWDEKDIAGLTVAEEKIKLINERKYSKI